MCRNIRKLRFPDRPPADQELEGAALQYVRKVTGYSKPPRANDETFETAVDEIAAATRRLFDDLVIR